MLARVLLHGVESPRPVQRPDDLVIGCESRGRREHMRHARLFVDDVDYLHSTEGAEVVSLAAARGIESGAIEIDAGPVDRNGPRGKFRQVGVGIVQAAGQGGTGSEGQVRERLREARRADER